MKSVVALLRGVNVGGRNMVSMAELTRAARELGFDQARTLLQSGNLLLGQSRKPPAELEVMLEEHTRKRFGLSIDFIVRTDAQWDAIVRANPFPEVAEDEPARLLAMFLKRKPDTNLAEALLEAIPGPERLVAHGSELYIHYPDGMGKSKLSGNMIESKLKARGTARNWNTVLKLHAMLRG